MSTTAKAQRSVALDDDQIAYLERKAAEQRTSVATIIRQAIDAMMTIDKAGG